MWYCVKFLSIPIVKWRFSCFWKWKFDIPTLKPQTLRFHQKKYLRRKCSRSSLSFWSWSSSCISDSIEVKSVKFDNSKSAKSLAMKKYVMSGKKYKKCVAFVQLLSSMSRPHPKALGFEVFSMIGSPSLHPTVRSSKDAALTDSWKSMRESPPRG